MNLTEQSAVSGIISELICLTHKNLINYDPNEKNVPSRLGT